MSEGDPTGVVSDAVSDTIHQDVRDRVDDPSVAFVLRGIGPRIDSATSSRLESLTTNPNFSWDRVLEIAQYQQVTPLLYNRLQTHCPELLPEDIRSRLRSRYHPVAVRNRYLAATLCDVVESLQRADVRVIPYKGPVLAQVGYGDLSARQFGDLDLLVAKEDMDRAASKLEDRGFEWQADVQGTTDAVTVGGPLVPPLIDELKCYRESDDLLVEIGWQLHKPSVPIDLDFESLWSHRTPVALPDGTVDGLSPVDRLLTLAHHGSRHRWACLKWIADFAMAMQQPELPPWEEIVRRATVTRCTRRLRIAAGLAATMLDCPLSPTIEQDLHADRRAQRIVNQLTDEYHRTLPMGPSDTLDFRYRIRTTDTARDAGMAAVAPLFPKLTEYESLPLPQQLFAGYYVVRPIRLLATRLRSGDERS